MPEIQRLTSRRTEILAELASPEQMRRGGITEQKPGHGCWRDYCTMWGAGGKAWVRVQISFSFYPCNPLFQILPRSSILFLRVTS